MTHGKCTVARHAPSGYACAYTYAYITLCVYTYMRMFVFWLPHGNVRRHGFAGDKRVSQSEKCCMSHRSSAARQIQAQYTSHSRLQPSAVPMYSQNIVRNLHRSITSQVHTRDPQSSLTQLLHSGCDVHHRFQGRAYAEADHGSMLGQNKNKTSTFCLP